MTHFHLEHANKQSRSSFITSECSAAVDAFNARVALFREAGADVSVHHHAGGADASIAWRFPRPRSKRYATLSERSLSLFGCQRDGCDSL